ncbi:MoaD/ThiS family protein [Microbacterium sp. BWT-B31]|uniref:MoaD/ThiS family protein n=1 Tax=Microbacterium sp. BWT-B31 TaxID=3232072 RepID=UPI0035272A8F
MALVRYFAAAQEAVGLDQERRAEATLGALRAAVAAEHPGLGGILPRCAVLVDGARVGDDTALSGDVLVDVLPPFAGG